MCPAADPSDANPDSAAINACLAAHLAVYLVPGSPGYIIDDDIHVARTGATLSSVGGKATLRADPGLARAMVRGEADNITITELILDGNRQNRTTSAFCTNPETGRYPGFYGSNLIVAGIGFSVHHVDTVNAMCGSGLEASGTNFTVHSVYSASNGEEAATDGTGGKWADGITVLRCNSGNVHDNYMLDNTDVGLVVFKGTNCMVRYNTVVNSSRYAFAGLKVGDPGAESESSLAGSLFHDNQVTSGYNLMTFGLMVGNHPWNANSLMTDVGEVSYNTVSGAMANLVVDGIAAGTIVSNSMNNPQGTRKMGSGCWRNANYTASDFGNAVLQAGWVLQSFDPGCQ